jgi:N-acyl homoserine lactone hydrolase
MRLYLFELARMETGQPVLGYLVQTEDGKNVLIDTGYQPGVLGESENATKVFFIVQEGQSVLQQLTKLSLAAADVHYVIATHFDPDHTCYINAFPHAEVVVQRSHLDAARSSSAARFNLTRRFWDDPKIQFYEVEGDTELLPGIELIETPGHVTGHQSVLLRLPESGPVLLPIDAMSREDMINPDTRNASPFDENHEETRKSIRKLLDIVAREKVRTVIFAHDAEQWATLRKSPEYYE